MLDLIYFSGQELCCSDTFPNSWQPWTKAFKEHVGGLSMELCFTYIRSLFSHGKLKWLQSILGTILQLFLTNKIYFALRLQHLQRQNGREKNLEHVEGKQFICSYTIGMPNLKLAVYIFYLFLFQSLLSEMFGSAVVTQLRNNGMRHLCLYLGAQLEFYVLFFLS